MKQLLYAAGLTALSIANLRAQQLMPILPPSTVIRTYEAARLSRAAGLIDLQIEEQAVTKELKLYRKSGKSTSGGLAFDELANRRKIINKDIAVYKMQTRQLARTYSDDELNADSRIAVNLVGGFAGVNGTGGMAGLFQPTLVYRVTDYKTDTDAKAADPWYVYAAFNARSHSSNDSGKLAMGFLFPGIVRRDLVLGTMWHWHYRNNNSDLFLVLEGSLNKYSDSSYDFRSESGLVGVRYVRNENFTVNQTTVAGSLLLFPYYGITNVQPKYFDEYRKAFGTSALPPTWHSLGLQVAVQGSGVQVFADAKYILNNTKSSGITDLQGVVYTIGTVLAVDLLRFRIL